MRSRFGQWKTWQQIIATGLAIGIGLVLGYSVAQVLFAVISPSAFGLLGDNLRLVIGVVLVLLIMSLAGAIGGFLGGWTLPVIGKDSGKYGFARPTAISMGVLFGTLLFLAVFGISLVTRLGVTSAPATDYVRIFLFIGALFGLVYGLLQGAKTVGIRRTGSIVLASVLGFAVGGAGLGLGMWLYFGSAEPQTLKSGMRIYILLGLFLFGFSGGVTLSMAYHRLAKRQLGAEDGAKPATKKSVLYYIVVGVAVVAIIAILAPAVKGLINVITPRESNLLEFIPLKTIGTHWVPQDMESIEQTTANSIDLSASQGNAVAMVMSVGSGQSDVFIATGQAASSGDEAGWTMPTNVSNSAGESLNAQVSTGPDGSAHIVWREKTKDADAVQYSVCLDGTCTEPVIISTDEATCPPDGEMSELLEVDGLDIASDQDGSVMVAWLETASSLQYAQSPDPVSGVSSGSGCISLPSNATTGHLALDGSAEGQYGIALDAGGEGASSVWLNQYRDRSWDPTWAEAGMGRSPDLQVGASGEMGVAWCDEQSGVYYWNNGELTTVAGSTCLNPPQLAQDNSGRLHLLWHSDVVETVLGDNVNRDVLYESIQQGADWSVPSIVAKLQGPNDFDVVGDDGGVLHMAWTDGSGQPGLQYAIQTQYECVEGDLTGIEQTLYQVARGGDYRPADDVIPFCANRYEDIIFTPNNNPAFTDKPPTLNGGYDQHAQLIETAEHEALFTTMAFDEAISHDSPGAVLADSVYKLYQKVLANPEDYPRGMHVRLMLGNSPPIAELELDAQLWHFLKDIREAGFEEMIDPEVGWKLEVANYGGAWPHSHVKTLIIDGKTVVASGFNHEYKPLPEDHPSGQGLGDTDTGLVITGPVAQHTRVVFEQLWDGAVQRHCDDLSMDNESWQDTCVDKPGVPADVAEAMKFYPTEADSVAFSIFRSHIYDESDQQILNAFSSAQESIDVAQAMYSMPSICILNHFFEVCSYYQAMPYMRSLMRAAENGAHLRLLLTPYPSQNIENVIAADIFLQEVEERGLADQVELRFFDTFLHSKSALIEDEFLIMGSQNLHYSAFAEGAGLAEYNLGTSDPAAIDQYKRMYEYYWDRSATDVD